MLLIRAVPHTAVLLLVAILLASTPIPAGAVDPPSVAGSVETPTPGDPAEGVPVEAALAEERAAIEAIRAEIASERAALGDGEPGPSDRERLDHLREIERITEASLQVLGDLDVEPGHVSATRSDAPASLGALAALYDEIATDRTRIADLEKAFAAARESRAQADEARSDAQREERRVAKNKTATAAGRVAAHERALLATAHAQLAALEAMRSRRAVETYTARIAESSGRIEELRASLAQSGEVLDTSGFVARADVLRIRLAETEGRRQSLDLQLEAASENYRRRSDARPDLLETVESLRAVRDLVASEESILRERIERLNAEELAFTRWHRVITQQFGGDELAVWLEESERTRRDLERERLRAQGHRSSLLEKLDAAEKNSARPDASTVVRESLAVRRTVLADAVTLATEEIDELDRVIRFEARFEVDARAMLGQVSFSERVTRIWQGVGAVFSFELTAIDDQPITVGKALAAILLFLAGIVASGRASKMFGGILARRGRVEPGVAGAVQTGSFYILLVSFTLLALRLVNFPLTAFTVAGGALAIGIGFGSQNILNNFISGLIIMFERPIRSHDLVEIEGTHGTVEQVGLRSTRIRAQDGRHIVVPNSFFLENNVVNWTLSDELVRGMFAVGVIYGSDTKRVDQLIDRALAENERVLREPAPVILFANFGDNSLDFHVYFWTRSRTPMGLQSVMSALRFAIDRLFREAGLVIAFPQRDVHLDSSSPIEIALVDRTRTTAVPSVKEKEDEERSA